MRYVVSARGGAEAAVDAPNWLAALGVGLDQLGNVSAIDRLACEVLVNGTVLARDARTGQGYVVRPQEDAGAAPTAAMVDEDADLVLGDGEDDPDDSELVAEALVEDDDDPSLELGELPSTAVIPLAPPPEPLDLPEPESTAIDPVGRLEHFDHDEDSDVLLDDDITDRFDRSELHRFVIAGLADIRDAVAVGLACERTLTSAMALVPAESGSVLLLEPDGRLRFATVVGPTEDQLTGSVLPAGIGISGFCLERATGIIVRRAATDPHFYREVDRVTGYTTHSVLCVPLLAGRQALGAIQLINPPSDRRFEPDDLRVVQDVAEALAQRLLEERLDG